MNQNNRSNSSMKSTIQKLLRTVRSIPIIFEEFCDNSNIHGLRYLSEKSLHWSERLLWLIAIAVSLGLCGNVTRNIWTKWSNNPTTINIIEKEAAISSIVFPTVTICPIKTPLKWSKNISNDNVQWRNTLSHIWPQFLVSREFQNDFADESIYDTFLMISSRYELLNVISMFQQLDGNIYSPVLTDKGRCSTFNALNSHDTYTDQMARGMMITKRNPNVTKFNLDTDLMRSFDVSLFPYHTMCSGRYGDLSTWYVVIETEPYDFDGIDEGIFLMVTMPGESLATMRNIQRIPIGENARVSVLPKVTTTSDDLRHYTPEQRQCYADSERQLRFFRIYTQFNCEEECLANFTAIECGCVKFNMPRDKNTAICGAAKIDCYKLAARTFRSDSKAKRFRNECNCMPTCTSIAFSVNIERLEQEKSDNSKIPKLSISVFYDIRMEIVERLPSYTYSDFFADCGSFFSVFLGISALSIIELIYYFTLRLFLTIRPTRPIQIEKLDAVIVTIKSRFVDSRLSHWMQKSKLVLVHFFENSNIHGVLYFTGRGLHWIEQLWWIIAFGLSVWLCSVLIANVWTHWQRNIVELSYTDAPISSVPFPTVTICPEIKFSTRKFDFDDFIHHSPLVGKLDFFSLLTTEYSLTKFEAIVYTFANFGILFAIQTFPWKFPSKSSESIYETIQNISLELEDVVKECRWRGQLVYCREYLIPILTEDGLCFAFNALNSHDIYTEQMTTGMKMVKGNPNVSHWNVESGYDTKMVEPEYPLPLIDSFEVTLIRHESDYIDVYKNTKMHYSGFKVALTTPGEMVDLRNKFFQVQVSEVAQITLNPKVTTISNGLRKYDPNQRGCFLQSERQLHFFKMYTMSNCETECLANATQKHCGCVKFSTPKNSSQEICGIAKYFCNNQMEVALKMAKSGLSLNIFELKSCNCLPACNTVDYNPTIDRVKFRNIRLPSMDLNASDVKYAQLSIIFENPQIEAIHQVEMYTLADFLSICGGLLGLFMGASVLSFIEIVYFFTLRLFWSVRRERLENRVIFF